MSKFFLLIYNFFARHKVSLYVSMVCLFALFFFFAAKVHYEEDVMRFIPSTANTKNITAVFQNLKVKDKVIVIFSGKGGNEDSLATAADAFAQKLKKADAGSYIARIRSKVGSDEASSFS